MRMNTGMSMGDSFMRPRPFSDRLSGRWPAEVLCVPGFFQRSRRFPGGSGVAFSNLCVPGQRPTLVRVLLVAASIYNRRLPGSSAINISLRLCTVAFGFFSAMRPREIFAAVPFYLRRGFTSPTGTDHFFAATPLLIPTYRLHMPYAHSHSAA